MKRIIIAFAAAALTFGGLNAQAGDKIITLYLDAAHGALDPGAATKTGEKEKDFTLQIAKKIEAQAGKNIRVVMIRNNDDYLPIQERADKTKEATGNAYLVSLHLEAAENAEEHGIGIIFNTNSQLDGTRLLARQMMHQFSKLGSIHNETKSLHILRESVIPAVVISAGYLTNAEDLAKLKTEAYQDEVAQAIIAAVSAL